MSSLEFRQATSVGDEGYGRIRTDIIFGRLKPGQRLRLDSLKQDYRLSIATLREILNRLTSDRLVLAEGKRGFEVAPISMEDLKELGELRLCSRATRSTRPLRAAMSSGKRVSSRRTTSLRPWSASSRLGRTLLSC